jgi:hypothetical protein
MSWGEACSLPPFVLRSTDLTAPRFVGDRICNPMVEQLLDERERSACRAFIGAVRTEVRADLVQASLFGSRARGTARPDSDLDIHLVFRWLPYDREPQASQAEAIADRIAGRTGVPITAWSVSLLDLARGVRTPMLVDALADAVPLWCAGTPIPRLPFTREDGLWCADRLLSRVEEGSAEFSRHLRVGDPASAARRGRDDVVRLCTALLLLEGETRPRRGATAAHLLERGGWRRGETAILRWVIGSFGPGGRDEESAVSPPPGGLEALVRMVDRLRDEVETIVSRPGERRRRGNAWTHAGRREESGASSLRTA